MIWLFIFTLCVLILWLFIEKTIAEGDIEEMKYQLAKNGFSCRKSQCGGFLVVSKKE